MEQLNYNLYSIILAVVIITVTTWYAIITRNILLSNNKNLDLFRRNSIIEVHARFQIAIREIQSDLPLNINDNNAEFGEKEPEIRRKIQMYWYLVLDEFITCKKLSVDKDLEDLWDDMYFQGMKSALRLKYFYFEIADLLSTKSTFLGYRKQFEEEIIRANNGFLPTRSNFQN